MLTNVNGRQILGEIFISNSNNCSTVVDDHFIVDENQSSVDPQKACKNQKKKKCGKVTNYSKTIHQLKTKSSLYGTFRRNF